MYFSFESHHMDPYRYIKTDRQTDRQTDRIQKRGMHTAKNIKTSKPNEKYLSQIAQ